MIINADCIEWMMTQPNESIDLAFADPPFNIGYDYDTYNDVRNADEYVSWCFLWMSHLYCCSSRPGHSGWPLATSTPPN